MKHYIHSTCSQDMTYPIYAGSQNQAKPVKVITVYGQANVVQPNTLYTPDGKVTAIDDEEYELLKKDPSFQRHVAHGFMKILDKSEFDGSDLQKRDGSAQLRDEDYAAGRDPRVPGSGDCQAEYGEGHKVAGNRGIRFVGEGY